MTQFITRVRRSIVRRYKRITKKCTLNLMWFIKKPRFVLCTFFQITTRRKSKPFFIVTVDANRTTGLENFCKNIKKQWYSQYIVAVPDILTDVPDAYLNTVLPKKWCRVSESSSLKISGKRVDVMFSSDCRLQPFALFLAALGFIKNNNCGVLYSDEFISGDQNTDYKGYWLKNSFSAQNLLSCNCIGQSVFFDYSVITKSGRSGIPLNQSESIDLVFFAEETGFKIVHEPTVLFLSPSYHFESEEKALEIRRLVLERRSIDADIAADPVHKGVYRIDYHIKNKPLVSIIIPFKDKPELLKVCVESILKRSTWPDFELLLVDNNSMQQETFAELERLTMLDRRIICIQYPHPFNYSAINNYAIENYAKGSFLVLLNNDIEVISEDWIESLLGIAQKKETGCVGALLYYPDDTIQHAGVIIGLHGFADHAFRQLKRDAPGYFGKAVYQQEISAVTAACMMVSRAVWDEANGLNSTHLQVAFNDIDFCLRVRELGYHNYYTPYCKMYHHESISRGLETTPEKKKRFEGEVTYVLARHKAILKKCDPFYNPGFSMDEAYKTGTYIRKIEI